MIYFLALLPATALTIAGYFVLFLAERSEGTSRTFGRYLGFWSFALAALVILGSIFAAAQGGLRGRFAGGPHFGGMMMHHHGPGFMMHRFGARFGGPPPGIGPGPGRGPAEGRAVRPGAPGQAPAQANPAQPAAPAPAANPG